MGKLFEKLILRTIQKHTEERNLLNASKFGFRADDSMTLRCMRRANHDTFNFNNNMSTAAVFLDVEEAFNDEGVGCRGDPHFCKSLRSNSELTYEMDGSKRRQTPLNTEAEESRRWGQ
jgi:hypothetical protein